MTSNRSQFSRYSTFTLSVLMGMIFNVGGLFAGRAAVLLNDLYEYIGWVFIIYPLMLTVRGDINGILTGKLGTELHLGSLKPSFRKNTDRFQHLIILIVIISVYDSILVGIVATLVSTFMGIQCNFFAILAISMTTFIIGAMISLTITFTITFWIFRKNGDPDVYVYPIMSSVNDIIVTLVFFSICFLYRPWKTNLHYYLGLPLIGLILGVTTFLIINHRKSNFIRESVKQALPTLTFTNIIAAGTGSVLTLFRGIIQTSPILLVVYPAVLSTVGGQGSVLANTTTTKLHLGNIKPNVKYLKTDEFYIPFAGIMTSGVIISAIVSILGFLMIKSDVQAVFFFKFLLVLIITNIIAYSLVGILAMTSAFLTYRFRLDPDNHVIPILSSTADLITTTSLVLIFLLIF